MKPKEPQAGDWCRNASCTEKLVAVETEYGGIVVVCLHCDNVLDWPAVKRGASRVLTA